MADNQDKAPEKIRIKDSYRERIYAESQQLDKSYLETLYFIIDCYFAFKKGAFPMQQAIGYPPVDNLVDVSTNQTQQPNSTVAVKQEQEEADAETFSLDFDL